LQQYKEAKIFEENLDEFDDSAEVVKNLITEYAEAEKSNYITSRSNFDDNDMHFEH